MGQVERPIVSESLDRHKKQVAVFGVVGLVCMVTDLGVYAGALHFGASPVGANLVAFLVANVQGYFLNGWLTFRREEQRTRFGLRTYGKYLAGYLFGLVLSTTVIWILAARIGPLPAKFVSIVVAAVSNYLVSHFFVFQPHKPAQR